MQLWGNRVSEHPIKILSYVSWILEGLMDFKENFALGLFI